MKPRQLAFEAIGTHWDIQVSDDLSVDDWTFIRDQLEQRIEQFDKAYSRFRPDSLVTTWSRQAGRHQLPADGYKLLQFYDQLYQASHGKVTPLIGQTMVEAGYDAAYSLTARSLTTPPDWDEIISYGTDFIELARPVWLDFGAAGKGYLIDIVGGILTAAGAKSYLINAGGDILYYSAERSVLSVGLENPADTSEVIGVAQLQDGGLGASSGAKRRWQEYHHIIDPTVLSSPQDILASWVMAADAMTADGLATALLLVPADQLKADFDFSYAILASDMSLTYDQGFSAEIFKAKEDA